MAIQRYDILPARFDEPEGDYVLYADHAAELAAERERADRAEAERDDARRTTRVVERPDLVYVGHNRTVRDVMAENAALRADAERYQWLRNADANVPPLRECSDFLVGEDLDAAIDAARGEGHSGE